MLLKSLRILGYPDKILKFYCHEMHYNDKEEYLKIDKAINESSLQS